MQLKICHLYPDVLNLYGDRGNVICMEKRLRWRGIEVETTEIPIGVALNAADYDLFFIGGGQDFEQEVLLSDLQGGKGSEICAAIQDGKTFLAICGGYQILGNYYKTWDGQQLDYLGALDLYTIGQRERMIGNYMFSCDDIGGDTVVGFENHSGKTYLGKSVRPLGKVLTGSGNNGEDATEGARFRNVFASYSHGCMLPKNPILTDHILKTALSYKYDNVELTPLNDTLERNAHDFMKQRLSTAK